MIPPEVAVPLASIFGAEPPTEEEPPLVFLMRLAAAAAPVGTGGLGEALGLIGGACLSGTCNLFEVSGDEASSILNLTRSSNSNAAGTASSLLASPDASSGTGSRPAITSSSTFWSDKSSTTSRPSPAAPSTSVWSLV